jgi:hypothetical protein
MVRPCREKTSSVARVTTGLRFGWLGVGGGGLERRGFVVPNQAYRERRKCHSGACVSVPLLNYKLLQSVALRLLRR